MVRPLNVSHRPLHLGVQVHPLNHSLKTPSQLRLFKHPQFKVDNDILVLTGHSSTHTNHSTTLYVVYLLSQIMLNTLTGVRCLYMAIDAYMVNSALHF